MSKTRHTITISFVSDANLMNHPAIDRLAGDMEIQVESLTDGTYSDEDDTNTENLNIKVSEISTKVYSEIITDVSVDIFDVNCSQLEYDNYDGQFTGLASELGIEPGKWPSKVRTIDYHGGKVVYEFCLLMCDGEDVKSAIYSSGPYLLEIYND